MPESSARPMQIDTHKGVDPRGDAPVGGSTQRCIITTCPLEAHRTWHVVASCSNTACCKDSNAAWEFQDERFQMNVSVVLSIYVSIYLSIYVCIYRPDVRVSIRVSNCNAREKNFKMRVSRWECQDESFKLKYSRSDFQNKSVKMRVSWWEFQNEMHKKRVSKWEVGR